MEQTGVIMNLTLTKIRENDGKLMETKTLLVSVFKSDRCHNKSHLGKNECVKNNDMTKNSINL